jgi:hypothetical protein
MAPDPNGRFVGACCQCKSQIWLPQALYDAALHGHEKITFYCPYGHPQVFAKGESEETKLRRERDQLVQRIAQKDDDIRQWKIIVDGLNEDLAASKRNASKLTKRISAGVCPCCHRSFKQLANHMKFKHPGFMDSREAG